MMLSVLSVVSFLGMSSALTPKFDCNYFEFALNTYAVNLCNGIDIDEEYGGSKQSWMYKCDGEDLMIEAWDTSDCSGTAYYSEGINQIGNYSIYSCSESEDCAAVELIYHYTNDASDTSCPRVGWQKEYYAQDKCAWDAWYGVGVEWTCEDGNIAIQSTYDNEDCSGTPLEDNVVESGCLEYNTSWFDADITCEDSDSEDPFDTTAPANIVYSRAKCVVLLAFLWFALYV